MADPDTSPVAPVDPVDAALTRLAGAHGAAIDLGLERLRRVAERAGLVSVDVPLVTVAGTNGKGSTVAMLAAVWSSAGYRVGTSTSPHLQRFSERIRLDGVPASDEALLASLAAIEPHVAPDTLTYFELASLLAMHRFHDESVDAIVLEVGLGGRLDAANLWDCDVAVLTSVALDHADWLGTDLDIIATEKAAIGRRGRPLVVAPAPAGERLPASLEPFATAEGMTLTMADPAAVNGPLGLPGAHQRRNAACVLSVVSLLQDRLPTGATAIAAGLADARVSGRMERRELDGVEILLDVAHNPAAARALVDGLAAQKHEADARPVHLLFAALSDKDIEGIAAAFAGTVVSIGCAPLSGPRALPVDALAARVTDGLSRAVPAPARRPAVTSFDSLADADRSLRERAASDGGVMLVAGSFQTVGDWLDLHAGASESA